MHVGVKKLATAGLLVAFSVVMMLLSSVIETSSLFFIATASFCVGVAIREWGLRYGFALMVASVTLNFLLAPSKLYCFTLAGMSIYIWVSEWLWKRIADAKNLKHRMALLWSGKYAIFNILYVPVLFWAPEILFAGKMNGLAAIIFLLCGQGVLIVYDVAYRYFQMQIWGRMRGRLLQK